LPKKDGKSWLVERRILPLLDGLDEVKVENRAACVEKINQLLANYGLQGLVVCSRIKDYTDLNVRLAFYRAIYLQPLTPEQIDEYLDQAGGKLASLRATLQADEALQSLARSPLILNIMSLAYQDTSAEALSNPAQTTDAARRKYLFDAYIARMFSRKVSVYLYNDERTKQWLAWLARNMQRHNQEVFLLENMQPSWVEERRWRWAYILASRLLGGLSIGLSTGLSAGMALGLIIASMTGLRLEGGPFIGGRLELQQLLLALIGMLVIGLIIGSALGLIGGLSVGLIDLLRFNASDKNVDVKESPTFWQSAGNVLVVGLILTLSVGLLGGLVGAFIVELLFMGDSSPGFQDILFIAGLIGLLTGPIAGLIGGLIFGVRGSRQNLANDVQTVEALSWSWRQALKGIPFGLIAGLIVTMITSWLGSFLGSPHPLPEALSVGLCVGLFGPIFSGLKGNIVEAKTFPNQGIRLSRQNAIFAGSIVGSISALFIGLFFGLVEGRTFGLNNGLIVGSISGLIMGSMGGLIVALWYGGLDIIQHYTLRLILIIQSHTPRNYARFLDYAVDHIFLQKVGGGYRFIHRMLLEHFAEMNISAKD